jgi:wyosine [tRNA(Phe)-imidazoG37] synthetase (radical SAM superfamily)
MAEPTAPRQPLLVHRDHRRTYEDNRYVYAVVSRRSKGVSIGVNLNPDKLCNFDCVYCQVDRTTPGADRDIDLDRLRRELDFALELACTDGLYQAEPFASLPPAQRRPRDIAFAGDGEPTTCREFPQAVQIAAEARRHRGLDDLKLVLITNATMLHRPEVQEALETLYANHGEVWAKLEAGTPAYYQQIERTTIPFARILENITQTARRHPVVIQALFLRLHSQPPPPAEQEAFCDRLREIQQAGGQIQRVQVYTVARRPAESYVGALANTEVDALAELVRQRTGLPTEVFYGVG